MKEADEDDQVCKFWVEDTPEDTLLHNATWSTHFCAAQSATARQPEKLPETPVGEQYGEARGLFSVEYASGGAGADGIGCSTFTLERGASLSNRECSYQALVQVDAEQQ